jgi:hypothetical protein
VEYFPDVTGAVRPWGHRRFNGSLEIVCQAKSTLSRDVLIDAVEEILAFGRLSSSLTGFFSTVYGEPDAPYSTLNLTQLHLNTDLIQEGDDTQSAAPWHPEDTLIFEGSLIIPVFGGFYNLAPMDSPAPFIQAVDVITYLEGQVPPSDPNDPVSWVYGIEYFDSGIVVGNARILSHDS